MVGVSGDRVHRWRRRLRATGTVADRPPGGVALHRLRPADTAEVLALVKEWGPTDSNSRKLAHRGSSLGRVWVSPSTVRRVLAAHGLVLPEAPAREPAPRVTWPDWLNWEPNKFWCWDVTHLPAAKRVAFAIVDVVSRRWIDTLVSIEETSTQVRVLFESALAAEGLTEMITPERVEAFATDASGPILLAASDNGPQMTSKATREFFAALAVAQRLGRPGAHTDQAWIESLFGHIKTENPHLEQTRDPAALDAELDRVRRDYNGTRLHAGIGYVTPDDEHTAAAKRSAKPASKAYGEPTNDASTTIAKTTTPNPRDRHELVNFSATLRGFLRHTLPAIDYASCRSICSVIRTQEKTRRYRKWA